MNDRLPDWVAGSAIGGATPDSPADLAARRRSTRAIVIGAVLMGLGIAVSVGTYAYAASNPRGGHYFLAWGPIAFGLVVLIRGVRSRKGSR